jgi:hypothetical protein
LTAEQENLTIGYLLCLLIQLVGLIDKSPFKALQKEMLMEDINDLQEFILRERAIGGRGVRIIDRIWKTFPEIGSIKN